MKNSGIEWIGEIPDSWELQPLRGHLIDVKESNDPIQTRQVLSLTNKLGVIPYEEKGEQGNKSKENYNEYKLAYPNTIVANSMNILIGSVGICDYFGCVSPVYYVFKPNDEQELKFLDYIFQSQPFQKELRRYAKGILEIRLRVSASDILRRQVAFPTIEKQKQITAFIDEKCGKIDELIANQEKQIEKLKEYKQSVIAEAVTKGLDKSATMKDSGIEWIGEIPCHWTNPKIKYYCKVESGATPERTHSEYWNGNINWFKTGELQNNEVFESEEKITDIALRKSSVKIFPEDTILVAMYGQGKTRGMTALLKTASTTNQACAGILLRKEGFDVYYLWWVLRGAYDSLRQLANGSGQPNLSGALISDFLITKPPIQEQKNIVSYLDNKCGKIDRLLSIKQEKIEKLQEYKKSLIYEYVTGKKEVV